MKWFPYMPVTSEKNQEKSKETEKIETIKINQDHLRDHPYQPVDDQNNK